MYSRSSEIGFISLFFYVFGMQICVQRNARIETFSRKKGEIIILQFSRGRNQADGTEIPRGLTTKDSTIPKVQ